MALRLYNYWRSTTSVRVRIALNLKRLDYAYVPVDLAAGEQRGAAFRAINPQMGVPVLDLGDGTRLAQSMAILRYLDRIAPEPPLLPEDPVAAARVEAAAHAIAIDIHPVNNSKVVARLRDPLGHGEGEVADWMRHWMAEGFAGFAAQIRADTPFCFGDAPGLADLCLVGQMVNARRWELDLARFARLVDIDARCRAIDAVARALPEAQPDAPAIR